MKKIIIAIDGHSSTGKSTAAKALSKILGYTYIDTGAMYRAVTLFALRKNVFAINFNKEALIAMLPEIEIRFKAQPETGLPLTYLNNENVEAEIRLMRVSERVSDIATVPEVRTKLVQQQQAMGQDRGIVMDGRDIGTVVFPNAELKVFMTANANTRAQRRYDELTAKGEAVVFDEILTNVTERDRIDSTRKTSPLRPAENSITLDNSNINRKQQLDMLLKHARAKIEAANK